MLDPYVFMFIPPVSRRRARRRTHVHKYASIRLVFWVFFLRLIYWVFSVFFFYVMLMISVVFYSLWLFSRMSRESPFPDIQRCIFLCSSFCFLNLRVQKDVTFSQTKKKNRGKLQFRGFLWTFLTFNLMAFYRFHIYLVNPPTLPLHLTFFVVL